MLVSVATYLQLGSEAALPSVDTQTRVSFHSYISELPENMA